MKLVTMHDRPDPTHRQPCSNATRQAPADAELRFIWIDGGIATRTPARTASAEKSHTFAQRHADAGTPVEVLQELMDHTSLATTQGYFRISMERKRAAADRVSRFRQDRYGQPVHLGRRGADSDQTAGLRTGIAMVAVPFGLCAEPSNVTAGGGACPIRYRCTACPHFSCDPSFLPELRAHLDELVRAREAGLAMGADEWALAPAAEITAFRGLIHSLEEQLASLGADERTAIDIASAELRRARQAMPVSFGKRPEEERGSHG